MDKHTSDALLLALAKNKQTTLEEASALCASDRTDEGNLKKAAANIYDIYQQMWTRKLARTAAIGEASATAEFEALLESIPKNWIVSLEAAKAHDDFVKVAVEEAKLSALFDIRTLYNKSKEGTL